ncbi:MAG TPA: response regulator [Pyrinomonadaceae bacterium]|nr:response regulator [Pyrinomonadaceae bacterium]
MEPTKGHILYVEDHEDTRVLMTIFLENAGYKVTPASNGRDALALARGGDFDLYLLNHTFPDVSGITLCEAIRELDAEAPIIFYSAHAMQREREAALRAGAQDYLIKPLDLFNIAEHVTKWIEAKPKRAGRGPVAEPEN